MATYFHESSEIQAAGGGDGLQTLILMNPSTGYVGFSDRQPPPPTHPPPGNNLVFFNSSNTPGGNSLNLIHAPPSQQLVGIPLTSTTSTNPLQDNHQQDVSSFHAFLPRVHDYNPYSHNFDHTVAREFPRSLSLRLSSQQQQQPSNYGSNIRPDEHHEVIPSQPLVTATLSPMGDVNVRVSAAGASPSSASRNSDDVNGMQGVILNSKFLKATQELLDEVVNVNKGLKNSADSGKGVVGLTKSSRELTTSETSAATTGEGQSNREITGKINESELTTTERQEIQMKKAKLVHMLDEVEQRYRQYHHQMQVVISLFEQSAGIGSAKTYTALALQAISRQFRFLKDAISSKVRAASRRLGEEDSLSGKNEGSKLKFIDNQLRQQRALQQLGMVQHNAWRPQRGLPERSVSVLRAWLFEHFLHPYPKESDKFMLAKQTGLTRSQVSNWFINARVRLWKPMVEEMYIEEMKEQEKKGLHVEEESCKSEHNEEDSLSPEKASTFEKQNKAHISNDQNALNQNVAPQKPPSLSDSEEMERLTQASPKKPRNNVILHSPTNDLNNESLSMNFGNERQNREGFSFVEGFGSYPIAELGRFSADQFQTPYSGNGFSLTLGLPQWGNLTMHGQHQPFLSNQNIQMNRDFEVGDTMDYGNKVTQSSNQGTNVYENINIQDRKRLAAQFLPDFVA